MSSNTNKILILVIGATGAQGQAVVKALLNPDARGNASPYSVRALTRDPTSKHALKLASLGVECVEGSLEDLHSVAQAMEGAYGAWVNTDGFTVGEIQEMRWMREDNYGGRTGTVLKMIKRGKGVGASTPRLLLSFRCTEFVISIKSP